VSLSLLGVVVGLAALDAFNPAMMVAVTLILVAAPVRPGQTALASVLGGALTVFALGAILFLAAGAAAGAVDGIVVALRFVAFAAAGTGLVIAGIRRLRPRERKQIQLPAWFTPWTALPFGALLTGADLPNAFPYFIAIERLIDADVSTGQGLVVLAGYALIYCLPCLVLLILGLLARRRTRAFLENITRRFGGGHVPRSVGNAIVLMALGVAVGTVPLWLL